MTTTIKSTSPHAVLYLRSDLAAHMPDPAPVLRRVADLEHQRATLADQLATLRAQRDAITTARTSTITLDQVRTLLRRLATDIASAASTHEKSACLDQARQALSEVIEKIELDPLDPRVKLHFALQTGDMVASPRPSNRTPVRWESEPIALLRRRAA